KRRVHNPKSPQGIEGNDRRGSAAGEAAAMFEERTFQTESAWHGGPLRKVGSGQGNPTKYICKMCRKSCSGVYEPKWVCGTCRNRPNSVEDTPFLPFGTPVLGPEAPPTT